MRRYWVYITASRTRVLYVGVTNSLSRRIAEHKGRSNAGFTACYAVDRLVYFEPFERILDAIAREKQLKGWRRSKKIALVESANPNWEDLADCSSGADAKAKVGQRPKSFTPGREADAKAKVGQRPKSFTPGREAVVVSEAGRPERSG